MKINEITDTGDMKVQRDTGREIHLKNQKTGVKTIVPKDPKKPGMITQDENGEYVIDTETTGEVDNRLKPGSTVKMKSPTQPGGVTPNKPKPQPNSVGGGNGNVSNGGIL